MEYLTGAVDFVIGTALPFLFVLGIVIFFHELGHFLVGRWCGVTVETFSIGFGRELFARVDKQGTRWRLALIPLGGYVKFLGDEDAASTPDREALSRMNSDELSRSFPSKSVGQRAAIVAAGPIANFLLAIVIFTTLFSFVGRQVTIPRVDQVQAGSPAERAGFQSGDVVKSVEGVAVQHFSDLQRRVSGSADRSLTITVLRDGQEVVLTATPERREVRDPFGNLQRIGVLGVQHRPGPGDYVLKKMSLTKAAGTAVKETVFIITRSLEYVAGLITGRESTDQLSGPIRVAKVSGDVASNYGFAALMNLTAIISVSIGFINLFPIPMLDGGHLVYYFIEFVRGRPLSERAQEVGLRIGLAIVLSLMVFATWNDIIHLTSL